MNLNDLEINLPVIFVELSRIPILGTGCQRQSDSDMGAMLKMDCESARARRREDGKFLRPAFIFLPEIMPFPMKQGGLPV